jgi:hypothetical protein
MQKFCVVACRVTDEPRSDFESPQRRKLQTNFGLSEDEGKKIDVGADSLLFLLAF